MTCLGVQKSEGWTGSPRLSVGAPTVDAGRVAIDELRSARVRREEYVGPWFPEPLLTDPYQDPQRSAELADSLSMAALLLLERLTPLERAVFAGTISKYWGRWLFGARGYLTPGNGGTSFSAMWYEMFGSGASALDLYVVNQSGTAPAGIHENVAPVVFTRGVWHKIEIYQKHSSEQLAKRNGPSDGRCALCGEWEDCDHIFFNCHLAKFMSSLSPPMRIGS